MGYRVMVSECSEEGCPDHKLEILTNYLDSHNFPDTAVILYPQDRLFNRFLKNKLTGFFTEIIDLNKAVKEVFSRISRELSAYLSPGRVLKVEGDDCYSCGWLFDPRGELILEQKQIFLNKEERESGLKRGIELEQAETDYGKIGFLLHTDCWYPEVGRFLALEGVDLVLATNTLPGGNYWKQLAGVWSQVQQNQFSALEASQGGVNLIHSLCDITPYHTGIIAPEGKEGEALNNNPARYLESLAKMAEEMPENDLTLKVVEGLIDQARRAQTRGNYNLLKLLNTRLYQESGLDLMVGGKEGIE